MNHLSRSLLVLTLFLSACSAARATAPATPLPANTAAPAATLAPAAQPTGQRTNPLSGPTATPLTGPQATPASIQPNTLPASLTQPRLVVLARDLPEPDDLLLAPDGSIYVSDVSVGTIHRYTSDGQLTLVLSGLNVPEGMLFLPDGSLLIAEQGKNRLARYNPVTQALGLFRQLENKTGQPGLDGIALDLHDPASPSIIIPDSPNGTLLRLSLGGQNLTVIGSGFVRPTGAWVEADGSILVVDENGGALKRLRPDGAVEQIAKLPTPDDVIEDAQGNIFVATLGDNAIHWISASGEDKVLVSELASPQGLTFDGAGDLVVADSGHHRLIKIVIH